MGLGNAGNSSRAYFQRAVERGNLVVAEITGAHEIGRLSLVEAL